MLSPSPGTLPGSRKRRAFSRHGPFSAVMDADLSAAVERPGPSTSSSDVTPSGQFSAKVTPVQSLMDTHNPEAEAEAETETESRTSPLKMANFSPPVTPRRPSKEIKNTIIGNDFGESLYRTPADRSMNSNSNSINNNSNYAGCLQNITMSPTLFQHLSIRSPRLSKSPGSSSFSQYSRSAVSASTSTSACGATVHTPINSHGSFDGSDTYMSVPNYNMNRLKTVPLTIISNNCSSYKSKSRENRSSTQNRNKTLPNINHISSSRVTEMNHLGAKKKKIPPLRSGGMVISPRPTNPSRYLPCPTPKSVPAHRRKSTFSNNQDKSYNGPSPKHAHTHTHAHVHAAAVVSVEKPVLPDKRSHYEDMSPMQPRIPFYDYNESSASTSTSTRKISGSPPPIKFLSMEENNKYKNKKNKQGQKQKGDPNKDGKSLWGMMKQSSMKMSTSRSMFKPASTESNDALNEMLYAGDTDGTLSDSDDEGGDNGFFLGDPSCLSFPSVPALPPRGSLSSILTLNFGNSSSNTDQTEGNGYGLSLAAAYSLNSKKKKVNGARTCIGDSNTLPTFPPIDRKHTSKNQTLVNDASKQSKQGITSESTSNTSLFGMNIIHENSISRGSLADVGMFPSTRKNSCKSFNEDSSSSGPFLHRSKSDQSINSIGLCIDSCAGMSRECSHRDMVTPPVNCRAMSSPPPLKQTKLTANKD